MGDKKHLSRFTVGECGIMEGQRFIVIARYPEDRGSGGTEVEFERTGNKTFWWDHKDPEAEFVGNGTVKTTIEWPTPGSGGTK